MYGHNGGVMAAGAGASLPLTGIELGWVVVAAATLVAAAVALLRLIPRKES